MVNSNAAKYNTGLRYVKYPTVVSNFVGLRGDKGDKGEIGGRCSDCRPGLRGDKGERGLDGLAGQPVGYVTYRIYHGEFNYMRCWERHEKFSRE